MSETLAPLHELPKKGAKWEWGQKQMTVFKNAKSYIHETHILVHYDPNKPFQLACDTYPYGLGATLSHIMLNNTEKPVYYASRTFSKTERNYSQIETEVIAEINAVKNFHQYLYGRHFVLLADHKLLLGLLFEEKDIPSKAAARIPRWTITLSAYNYSFKYSPGFQNQLLLTEL